MTSPKENMSATDSLPPPPSWAEKYEIVNIFVRAFFGGQIKMKFLSAKQLEDGKPALVAMMKAKGSDPIQAQISADMSADDLWAIYMEIFNKNAHVIYGSVQASEDQRKEAVNFLLDYLWSSRVGQAIDGEFWAVPNLEKEVRGLAREVEHHSRLLDEVEILLRSNPRPP